MVHKYIIPFLKDGDLDALACRKLRVGRDVKNREDVLTNLHLGRDLFVKEWKRREATWFDVYPVEMTVGDLTVSIAPDVGMQTLDIDNVLIVWARWPKIPPSVVKVYKYLAGRSPCSRIGRTHGASVSMTCSRASFTTRQYGSWNSRRRKW